jgi:CRP-like cAMP-binding protein
LWRIERGAVRTVTWSEQGTLITLGYWGTGDIVGQPLSRVVPYQIECLTSVEASIISSELWHQTLDAMLLHIQQSEELLSIIHRKPVSLRLWQFLMWLSTKFGRDVDRGKLIDIGVTHQEIAEVINTTRVSVTRMLQQFEEQGMLLRHQRRLILLPTEQIKL